MKFQVIYADPPWEIKKVHRAVRPMQIEMDYSVMPFEEIKALPVRRIAADKSILFLWTVNKFLLSAPEIVEAWGFRFQRMLTWDKGNGLCFFGFHHRTEFCLVGTRGKWDMYPHQKTMPTLIVEHTWRQHSKKPEIMYENIERFGSPRIELFARSIRVGWLSIGYEITGNDIRTDLQFLADLMEV